MDRGLTHIAGPLGVRLKRHAALVQQREQLSVQRESLAAESALEQQIQTYVNAGARTVADLYQQQANAASARLALVQAERAAAVRRLPALETSLLLLLEPVLNPIWTWLIRREDPGAWTIAGGAVIVAATGIKLVYEARRPNKEQQ